jgi:hypothetical protein
MTNTKDTAMTIDDADAKRIREIETRLSRIDANPWRNTIRRETPDEVSQLIRTTGGPGVPRCSEVVVNTDAKPTHANVICWMGPAAAANGDDLHEAEFIANAKRDIEWLLSKINDTSSVSR